MQPPHDCCSYCITLCSCEKCSSTSTVATATAEVDLELTAVREVVPGDRELLRQALQEVKDSMVSSQLIDDIVENCDKVFNLEDVIEITHRNSQ